MHTSHTEPWQSSLCIKAAPVRCLADFVSKPCESLHAQSGMQCLEEKPLPQELQQTSAVMAAEVLLSHRAWSGCRIDLVTCISETPQ